MPSKVRLFTIKDSPGPKGKILFEGCISDICAWMNSSSSQIYQKCDTGKPLFGVYYIYSSGKGFKNLYTNEIIDKPKAKPKKKTEPNPPGRPVRKVNKKKENYLRILRCLDIYGNTSCSVDPKIYAKNFKKDGYVVDIRYRPKIVLKGKGYAETEIWDEIWIITLKEKLEVK